MPSEASALTWFRCQLIHSFCAAISILFRATRGSKFSFIRSHDHSDLMSQIYKITSSVPVLAGFWVFHATWNACCSTKHDSRCYWLSRIFLVQVRGWTGGSTKNDFWQLKPCIWMNYSCRQWDTKTHWVCLQQHACAQSDQLSVFTLQSVGIVQHQFHNC